MSFHFTVRCSLTRSSSVRKMLFILFLCVGLVQSGRLNKPKLYNLDEASELFETFIVQFNKQYKDEVEKQMRFEIFKENLKIINKMNSDPKETAHFGINHFTDLTKEEFSGQKGCLSIPEDHYSFRGIIIDEPWDGSELPETVDYRPHMTPVKDQLDCGSCWAFATTGSIEAYYHMKYGKHVSLSEQQLVDCTQSGCYGGYSFEGAGDYIIDAGGLESDQDYPYKGKKMDCAFKTSKVQAKLTNYTLLKLSDEQTTMSYLYKYGPLSIGISLQKLKLYTGGILSNCEKNYVDHGVVLAGYGTEDNVPYWIMRNSWNSKWGENGYFRVARNGPACNMMKLEAMKPNLV